MKIIIFVMFLIPNLLFAWSDKDKSTFFNSCFKGMMTDSNVAKTTAIRYCNCSTNMISRIYTVNEMHDMIKKGKWGLSNKDLNAISQWCLTGDY